MCFIDSWRACVTPLLNRFARTLIQIGALFVPRVVCQISLLTCSLVYRWMSWRYTHSEALQLQYTNRSYYLQRQAKRTSRSMWRFLSRIIRYDATWKSWKKKPLCTWGFKSSRGHGVLPRTVCQGVFFLFLCVCLCGRFWTGVSAPHAERAHCYLHCNLGKTHCLTQAAGLVNQLPVYCSVLVVRDVDDI